MRGALFEPGQHDVFRDIHLHGCLAADPEPEQAADHRGEAASWPAPP